MKDLQGFIGAPGGQVQFLRHAAAPKPVKSKKKPFPQNGGQKRSDRGPIPVFAMRTGEEFGRRRVGPLLGNWLLKQRRQREFNEFSGVAPLFDSTGGRGALPHCA